MPADQAAALAVADGPLSPAAQRTLSIGLFEGLVAAVLCLAAILRLWNIGSVPPELHPDEMAGFLGVRDMLTGHTPLSPFIDYRVVYLPLYGIFETTSAFFFGNTITALRLPAAFLGVVTTFATGLLAYQIVRSRLIFLGACLIMAILPWDISISRVGWEPAAALPFLLLGLYFLRHGLYEDSGRDIAVGFALLAIGAYSYRAELFNAIALTLALLAIEFRLAWRAKAAIALSAAGAVLILMPLIVGTVQHPEYLSSGPAQGTFGAGVNATTLGEFWRLYQMQFSFDALFYSGDGNLQHGPAFGVLYLWMLPFMLVALLTPWRPFTLQARLLLLAWLVLYPVGGAVTDEGLHFIRTLTGAPLACILTAIGFARTCAFFQQHVPWQGARRGALAVLVAVVSIGLWRFVNAYFVTYPETGATIFHSGDHDVFAFVRAHEASFARVCFTALDPWNYPADIEYYMQGDPIATLEGLSDPACKQPDTLLALRSPSDAPDAKTLVGTVQRRDGTVRVYFMTWEQGKP
jgi:hypothetical protein